MFFRPALRTALRAGHAAPAARFHAAARMAVAAGDKIPSVTLFEDAPDKTVNVADELKAGGVLIGVPAAFSPTCSNTHIPDWISSSKLAAQTAKGPVFVVSVNDAFVMKAWGDSLDPGRKSGIRFLADPTLALTKSLELDFDGAAALFGGSRSVRYALTVGPDGKVEKTFVEPDNIGLSVSAVDNVLKE